MRLIPVAAILAALATASLVLPVTPADAQSRNRAGVRTAGQPTVIVWRGDTGRARTRIVVQRRSYLDGGTEVLPGQRKFTDYVNPPGYRPFDVLGPGKNGERTPLNGPFDYGFRNHP
jgi:hypothetical protein